MARTAPPADGPGPLATSSPLPIIRGSVIRVEVEHLPTRSTGVKKTLWLWWSGPGEPDIDLCSRAHLRHFDIEHRPRPPDGCTSPQSLRSFGRCAETTTRSSGRRPRQRHSAHLGLEPFGLEESVGIKIEFPGGQQDAASRGLIGQRSNGVEEFVADTVVSLRR